MSARIRQFYAPVGGRLDKILTDLLPTDESFRGFTRSQVKVWIEAGHVTLNGVRVTKAGTQVEVQDRLEVEEFNRTGDEIVSYDAALDVLHEDEALIVINKPAGMTVHPGAGNSSRTLVNALVHHFKKGSGGQLPETLLQPARQAGTKVQRPGIVHRLDKDTTGVLVVAKSLRAHAHLSNQFAARTVGRRYVALAFRTPRATRVIDKSEFGTISASLARHPGRRKEMTISEKGRHAVTHWRIRERYSYGALVELKLETGRTHQIRIHLNSIGSPIIGDRTYGDFSGLPAPLRKAHDEFGRQALHAEFLEFTHPESLAQLAFSAPIPVDMQQLITIFTDATRS